MLKLLYNLSKIGLILTLPFIILIRGAVYGNDQYGYAPYPALLMGIAGATLILLIYLSFLYSRLFKKHDKVRAVKKIALLALMIVFAYCLHGLFFISDTHLKDEALKNELRHLHPIIRVAVGTLTFVDKDMIITDASRVTEDYKKMGLKTPGHSLHYIQETGYAHALDIRTRGRSDFENFLVKSYFKLMGFNTLRHGGTGDHLHISLNCSCRKGAI